MGHIDHELLQDALRAVTNDEADKLLCSSAGMEEALEGVFLDKNATCAFYSLLSGVAMARSLSDPAALDLQLFLRYWAGRAVEDKAEQILLLRMADAKDDAAADQYQRIKDLA